MVNKSQTFEEQQNKGIRPRFSIKKEFIEKKRLKPKFIINIKKLGE